MDNNYNYQMNNQVNGYEQNPYQQNMYQQGMVQQNMYQGNGYNQRMYKRKSLDIKGLVITILCLITSVMTVISLFMPIVKTEEEGASVITIWGTIGDVFENIGDDLNAWLGIYIILSIVAPILIAVFGIIASVLLIIKLTSQKFNGDEVGHVRRLFKYEIIMSAFSVLYILFACIAQNSSYYFNIGRLVDGESSLSVGWYLPVIMCISTIAIVAIVEYIFNLKDKKFNGQYVVNGILAIVTAIFSSIMFMSFALSQIVVPYGYYEIKVDVSLYITAIVGTISQDSSSFDEYGVVVVAFIIAIIVIAILSSVVLKKSLAGLKNGKFSGAMSIVAGSVSIVLYVAQIIIYEILAGDDDVEIKMGAAGYMYIIFGALLIVTGIVQICVRNYHTSKENYASHPLLNGNGMPQQSNMPQNGYRPY